MDANNVSATKDNNKNLDSFKDSLKATSFLGGIQVVGIIISIIRSKLIAVLLGPFGMGLIGMFQNTASMISSLTNLGLGVSAVKDISEANASGNKEYVSLIVSVFNRLVVITGLVGALICCIFCKQISIITFGDDSYTYSVMLLSVVVFLTQLTLGRTTKLQGLRYYKYMATASILGNILGLVTVIPLYYLYGTAVIVPGLVLTALISFGTSDYFSRKVKVIKHALTVREVWSHGNGMVKMGFFIGLNAIMASLVAYVLKVFIAQIGSIDDVGLYAAGFAIVETYVNMVFTSISTDYYPRLSAVHHDKDKFRSVINNQMEILLLILGPLVVFFIVFSKIIIEILYSTKFVSVETFLSFAMLGMLFRGFAVLLDYCFLVHGDTRLYFFNSLSMKVYVTLINLWFYYLWGLNGLGYACLLGLVLNAFQIIIISMRKYHYAIRKDILLLFIIQLTLGVFCVYLSSTNAIWRYTVGSVIVLISTTVSYKKLKQHINIKAIFNRR